MRDKLNKIRNDIGNTYLNYIGAKKDKKVTLLDVLAIFNIEVDKTRLDDYKIESISFSDLAIWVRDKKNNMVIKAKYTHMAKLLNAGGSAIYIDVNYDDIFHKWEKLYDIDKNILAEQLTFKRGNHRLILTKEYLNQDAKSLNINYALDLSLYERQNLLTKEYIVNEEQNETLEKICTYEGEHLIECQDEITKYCVNTNGNIVYAIEDVEIKNKICNFNGVCFEQHDIDKVHLKPFNIDDESYPVLFKKDLESLIIFVGYTDDSYYHEIEIGKGKEHIKVKYISIKNRYNEDEKIIANDSFILQKTVGGKISPDEIANIISELIHNYPNDLFIRYVVDELNNFIKKIKIRNNETEEEIELLSPKNLFNVSFSQIYSSIMENLYEYFDEIALEFDQMYQSDKTENCKKKVMN